MSDSGIPTSLAPPQPESGVRLHFLDGIRALAALYVVMDHHVSDLATSMSRGLWKTTCWMCFGHYAVDVFIVLSGYCLMLPIAKRGGGGVPGGLREYLRRRSLRILPPYFAALILALLVIWFVNRPDHITPGDVVTHFLVVHNFSSRWIWSINPPLWSVAVEWQIYFVFPLILLPIWRRWGGIACVAAGLGLGMLPHFLLSTQRNLDWSFPWYIGLFAMGMAAAVESYRKLSPGLDRIYRAMCVAVLLLGFTTVAYSTYRGNGLYRHLYLIDILLGTSATAGLIWSGRHCIACTHPRPLALRFLSSGPLVAIGAMSFSVYLIHVPIWWLLEPKVKLLGLSPGHELAIRIFFGIPAALFASYVFYYLIERPCMMHRKRAAKSAEAPGPFAETSAQVAT